MKKRIITLCMAVMLLAIFVVSAFAATYNDVELPDIRPFITTGNNFIYYDDDVYILIAINGEYTVGYSTTSSGTELFTFNLTGGANEYHFVDDNWVLDEALGNIGLNVFKADMVWSSVNIVYNGDVLYPGSRPIYPIIPVDPGDMSQISAALTGQINVQHTVSVIALAVTACVGLAFMWWGLRKAIAAIMAAFRKGKINL